MLMNSPIEMNLAYLVSFIKVIILIKKVIYINRKILSWFVFIMMKKLIYVIYSTKQCSGFLT